MVRYAFKFKPQDKNYCQIGFGPGVSVADKVRPRVMGGLGWSSGGRHNFVIDAGCILGYTDRLSVVYDEQTFYHSIPGNLTVSKLNLSYYFSIVYMFH